MAQDYYGIRCKLADALAKSKHLPESRLEFVAYVKSNCRELSNAQYNLMLQLYNTYVLEPEFRKFYLRNFNINCHEHTASDRISQYRKLGIHKVVQGF